MTAAMDPRTRELLTGILARGSKSFSFASRFLGAESRLWAAALYAWCRRVDDAVDDVPPDAQPAALAAMRADLDGVYAGEPQPDPVLAAFQAMVRARAVPRVYAEELLDGMAMDVAGTRYDDLPTLLLYCHRVAGVVGLMMVHVLGTTDPRALRPAAHLGIAFQLTNICRDVEEDWQLGRRYLPASLLGDAAADLDPRRGGPLPREHAATLAGAVRQLLDLADDFYASADDGIRLLPWRSALGIRAARWVYWAIGRQVRRRGYDVFAGRAWVRSPEKLVLAARALATGATELPARLAARERHAIPQVTVRFPDDVLAGAGPAVWRDEPAGTR